VVTGATDGIGKAYAEAVSIALDLSVYKTNPLAVATLLIVFTSLFIGLLTPLLLTKIDGHRSR
jgi:hypothetical protein